MGVSIYYEALPATGRLLHELQSDGPVGTLYCALSNYGGGAWFWDEIDVDERDEILESVSERLAISDIDAVLARMQAAIAQQRDAQPDGGPYGAAIEKCDAQIEAALEAECARLGAPESMERVRALLGGNGPLLPDAFEPGDPDQLYLVPATDVAAGADVLRALPQHLLLLGPTDRDRHVAEVYAQWRDFYVAAADRGDVVLVGFST